MVVVRGVVVVMVAVMGKVEAVLVVVCVARPARAKAGEPPHHPLSRPQQKLTRGLTLLDAGVDEVGSEGGYVCLGLANHYTGSYYWGRSLGVGAPLPRGARRLPWCARGPAVLGSDGM